MWKGGQAMWKGGQAMWKGGRAMWKAEQLGGSRWCRLTAVLRRLLLHYRRGQHCRETGHTDGLRGLHFPKSRFRVGVVA